VALVETASLAAAVPQGAGRVRRAKPVQLIREPVADRTAMEAGVAGRASMLNLSLHRRRRPQPIRLVVAEMVVRLAVKLVAMVQLAASKSRRIFNSGCPNTIVQESIQRIWLFVPYEESQQAVKRNGAWRSLLNLPALPIFAAALGLLRIEGLPAKHYPLSKLQRILCGSTISAT